MLKPETQYHSGSLHKEVFTDCRIYCTHNTERNTRSNIPHTISSMFPVETYYYITCADMILDNIL
jgi:hypothetical protein